MMGLGSHPAARFHETDIPGILRHIVCEAKLSKVSPGSTNDVNGFPASPARCKAFWPCS